MRGAAPGDKSERRFQHFDSADNSLFSAFAGLTETVFEAKPLPAWSGLALLDDVGLCVAGLQYAVLQCLCDGEPCPVAALRNVAVAPYRRGEGLMRGLMSIALQWCDRRAGACLLYTETPDLYTRYGFAGVPQHAFVASAPRPVGSRSARSFDCAREARLLDRLVAARLPVSQACAVIDDAGLIATKLGEGGLGALRFSETLDALIVSETLGETLVVVDLFAARIPSLAAVLGALGVRPTEVRTLFPPDRLEWPGIPVLDDTGLMARGTLPPAMHRPFMLPPTVAF